MTQVALEGSLSLGRPEDARAPHCSPGPQAPSVSEISSWTSLPQLRMSSGRPKRPKPAKKSGTRGEEGLIGHRVPGALPFRAVPEPQDSRIKPDSQDSDSGFLILPPSPHSQAMTWGAQLHSETEETSPKRGRVVRGHTADRQLSSLCPWTGKRH